MISCVLILAFAIPDTRCGRSLARPWHSLLGENGTSVLVANRQVLGFVSSRQVYRRSLPSTIELNFFFEHSSHILSSPTFVLTQLALKNDHNLSA